MLSAPLSKSAHASHSPRYVFQRGNMGVIVETYKGSEVVHQPRLLRAPRGSRARTASKLAGYTGRGRAREEARGAVLLARLPRAAGRRGLVRAVGLVALP